MIRQTLTGALALGLLWQDAAFAQKAPALNSKQVQITWEELSGLVIDRKVSITLPDRTRLEGDALAVRPEALVVDVHKTSNRNLYPKGQTEVSRMEISEVRVIRMRGPVMRIVGGILGGLGGLWGTAGIGFLTPSAAVLLPLILVGIPLAAVGGYYAGKLADTQTTKLLIQRTAPSGDVEELDEVSYEIR